MMGIPDYLAIGQHQACRHTANDGAGGAVIVESTGIDGGYSAQLINGLGNAQTGDIIGKVFIRVWPFSRIGSVD